MQDKIFGIIIKLWTIGLIIGLFYGTGILITALFLGDYWKVVSIINRYSLIHKIIISIISAAFIISFSNITTYLFKKFVLNKQ